MIPRCATCRRYYWRYRPDFPPAGSCSLLCHSICMDKPSKIRPSKDGPGSPAAIIELIKSHNRSCHSRDSDNNWDDWMDVRCAECERLEAQLAAAIAYHMPATAPTNSPNSPNSPGPAP